MTHSAHSLGSMLTIAALHIDPTHKAFNETSLLAAAPPIRGGNWLEGVKSAASLLGECKSPSHGMHM